MAQAPDVQVLEEPEQLTHPFPRTLDVTHVQQMFLLLSKLRDRPTLSVVPYRNDIEYVFS